ncbi:DNA excision repair protein ERCC-6-like [Homarus americanus]|uniref:DNA excision repair protein ERCC-6 n=1 Tax=Homarus americanus TaxID=6706 RepID=A0A8J5JVZ1_HOMAM|nr:DNA excision repair protein ERCC-6-like [Homarus americanus]
METQVIERHPSWQTEGTSGDNTSGDSNLQAVADDPVSDEGHVSGPDMENTMPVMSSSSSSSILHSLLSGDNKTVTGDSSTRSIAQDLQDQDDELRALGISVVDQLSLERDVEAAVDKAVAKHTRKQRLQILKKEIKDIKTNIKQGENKLNDLKNRLSGMRQRVVDPRMAIGVEVEVRDKTQQLKTLTTRERILQQKLESAEVNEAELDNLDLEDGEILDDESEDGERDQNVPKLSENERDRLIRNGQMTPFGTAMTSTASRTVSVRPTHRPLEKRPVVGAVQEQSIKKRPTRAEMISSGDMTPFGSVVKMAESSSTTTIRSSDKPQGVFSDFEKYLKDQIDRQKQHSEVNKGIKRKKTSGDPTYGIARKRKRKIKEYVSEFDDVGNDDDTSLSSIKSQVKAGLEAKMDKTQDAEGGKKKSRKDPLKVRILHPKKKKKTETVSGSVTSHREADQYKETPRRILSERVCFQGSDSEDFDAGSGSEYVPSDPDDVDDLDDEVCDDSNDENANSKALKGNRVEKMDKAVKRQRKKKDKLEEDNWSDDDVTKSKGRKSLKSRDDGNIDDYVKRIENWKEERLKRKQRKIIEGEDLDSEEEEEEGYEEFDGGFKIPLVIWNKLYKYQRTCVKWLWELHSQGCGGILGDEMGLGKTIMIISFLVGLSYSRLSSRRQPWKGLGPVLIVCPATVLHQWVKEFHKWWPPFRIAVLHESGTFTGKRPALIHNINNLKELWSLFDFVFPGKLGTLPVFLQQFAVPITQGGYANASKLEVQTAFKCASVLRDTINPFLLRRMKNDVRNHLNLPDKNEQVLFCGLTEDQRKVYRDYIEGDQVKWIMGGRMKVFVGLINLRKICNHPDLYTGGPNTDNGDWNSGLQPELKYGWWSRSGKMHVLHAILHLWSRQGHRVLLFTQSRQMMCILEKFLVEEHYTYLKMDGTTAVSSRQPLIEKFNNDTSCFVFLLTTRVGGLGINLTGADRVVIFDPDWNPSTDSQARERAWRIGQLRHVTIYRLLTSGTIEEKIYHRQIFKQFLTNRVLKDPKQQRFFKTNDLYELFSLNEGDKEKSESSAIFAGTESEITVQVKGKTKDDNRWAQVPSKPSTSQQKIEARTGGESSKKHQDIKTSMSKERKKIKKSEDISSEKKEEDNDVLKDNSKMERMRELARRLSQKIGVKCPSKDEPKKTLEVKKTSEKVKVEDDSESNENSGTDKIEAVIEVKQENPLVIKEEQDEGEEEVPLHTQDPPQVDAGHTEDSAIKCEGKESEDLDIVQENPNDGEIKASEAVEGKIHQPTNKVELSVSDESKKHKRKHKKKDKHREKERTNKSKRKGRKFEGERIEFLVKKRNYRKTEEEEEAEKETAKSQDQYVLEKLFQKSGVHTALSHDAIMSNSDPDYLLMEGEAERVAKEAVKAVRASRAQCFRPRLSDGSSGSNKRKTIFGSKKNKLFDDTTEKSNSKVKETKKKDIKPRMFNGGIEEDDDSPPNANEGKDFISFGKSIFGSSGSSSSLLSSSQLLSRMRERNKGITEDCENEDSDDYDPDYPSTAAIETEDVEPEVQDNIDLLADIRNFVAFQAKVDGRASTQEVIERFRDRLPSEQTSFFKALLTQICDFHRETNGKGMWSLKGDFR